MELIIFGESDDPHVKHVADQLINYCNINMVDLWKFDSISHIINESEGIVKLNNVEYDEKSSGIIWWRLKPKLTGSKIKFDDSLQEKYWKKQWSSTMESIDFLLTGMKSVNTFYGRKVGSLKPVQLKTAKAVGFNTPSTIVGNSPNEIQKLGENIFFKHLNNSFASEKNSPIQNYLI